MKDMHSDVQVAQLLPAAAYDADNTPAALDLKGFNACEIVLAIGAGGITFSGTNKVEFKLTHSDDNVTYADVADADILGKTGISSGIIKSLVAAHASAAAYRFGYIGGKRYLKLLADFGGTHGTATPLAALALLGHPQVAPVAAQA